MLVLAQPVWLLITHRASYILLFLALLISSYCLLRHRLHTPRVKLKDGFEPQTRKGMLSKMLLDRIDTDLTADGEPVDLARFWHRVSWASGAMI